MLRALREIRWRWHRWSSADDRDFHDDLFGGAADYDPFTFAYPGYLTIRRFADLAADSITPDVHRVVDVGCGPGEITCELARRFPLVQFVGLDHSRAGVERAAKNAARLGLTNVSFVRGDAGESELHGCDLVIMCDSFHHLPQPRAFVDRARQHCSRFFLLEPGGAWHGGWARQIEFDWLLSDLDIVRARVDGLIGDASQASRPAPTRQAQSGDGEAVERRYTLDDLAGFFPGLRVSARGTVAGFDAYPPDPYAISPSRAWIGEIAYRMICDIDARLLDADRDLAAKHWGIAVSPDPPIPLRRVPTVEQVRNGSRLQGPYDAELSDGRPERLNGRAGQKAFVHVRVANRSWREWRSDAEPPIFVSYHWCTSSMVEVSEGGRTAFPRPLAPGDAIDVTLEVMLPAQAGEYVLAIQLLEEGVCWFTSAGVSPLTVPARVE
jgi:SAM-dependent methyltransferase